MLPWNIKKLLFAFQHLLFPDPCTVSSDYWNWLVWRLLSVNPVILRALLMCCLPVEVLRNVFDDIWDPSVRISCPGSLCYAKCV